uniref:Piwi domain-containing protein n=1 Tax=Strigamia maritima TaxID=126957 RepID=T1IXK7_STRMM
MANRGRGSLIERMAQMTVNGNGNGDTALPSTDASLRPKGRGQILAQFMATIPREKGDAQISRTSETQISSPIGRGETATMRPMGRGELGAIRPIGRGITTPAPALIPAPTPTPTPTPALAPFARGFGRANLLKQFDTPSPVSSVVPVVPVVQSENISSTMSDHSFASDPTPAEPVIKRGTKGKPVPISTNYVRLKCVKDAFIYEYHVTFIPQVDSKKLRMRLVHESKHVIGPTFQFDGAKLYLPLRMEKIMTTVDIIHPYEKTPQQVNIKYVTKQNLTSCNHLFNVLFKRIMNILALKLMARKYYDPKEAKKIPQYKLQIWPGYVTSVAEYEGGLLLMCDAAHKVLRDSTAHEVIKDCHDRDPRGDWMKEAAKQLIGSVVLTRYNNRTYRIDDIDWGRDVKAKFTNHMGQELTFLAYYKKQYQIEIEDDEQPLLIHQEKPARGTTESKRISLVPELAHMTGVSDKMISDFQLMKSVSAHTRLTPNQRQFAFKRFLENVHKTAEATKQLSDWGLELETNMLQLQGRVLEPTKLIFGNGKIHVVDERADWNNALCRGGKAFVAIDLKNWGIIFCNNDSVKTGNFKEKALRVGPALGMEVAEPIMIKLKDQRNETFVNAIDNLVRERQGLQIIVTICPTARDDRYSAIKKRCYLELGMASQVINLRTISRDDKLQSVTQKILLQMNCKLGGELWGVNCPIKNLMIVGMDVYHDASRRGQSVLGFVSSLNPSFTKWFSKTVFQSTHQELGDGLRTCMMAALKKFFDVNRILPEKIVVYRDGVSDGQLRFVVDHEILQIENSFKMTENYKPKLSVVIVQKRINTRIFANTGRGELANPMPGTILDHTVTRFQYYDFFLVSQHVTQGTVTPTHYIVIKDENDFPVDIMQKLTYILTHMYFNWPGTVRVPAPCQNIYFVFEFCLINGDEFNACGRQSRSRHLTDVPCGITNDVTFCATAGAQYPWQALIQFVTDNRSLMKRMYGETRQSVVLRREMGSKGGRSLDDKKNKTVVDIPDLPVDEGINACPSRTEVVSPYWANSTRGDIVAILNVYPFEQFVYFEKCEHDSSRTFCPDGCRCEQQHGLQRLLAFDPTNECRGIFSEWFRFPMCCVCRCYFPPATTATSNDTFEKYD